MKLVFTIKKYRTSIILFLVFETIAVWLWQATGKLFFLLIGSDYISVVAITFEIDNLLNV